MANVRRQIIYTSERVINRNNVVAVLKKAFPIHLVNASRIQALFDYESGEQPIIREKIYRPEINIQTHDNLAHEVTKFHVGYEWSNPITLVQNGDSDARKTEAISSLNEQYDMQGIKAKSPKLGTDVTIGNLGYTHIDVNTEWEPGESFFTYNILSPFTTFVVRSSYYIDKRVMMSVTFRQDDLGIKHFTCYTKDTRFEVSEDKVTLEELNPLGRNPITEWIGNYDGMGIWEHEIDEMNNLNLMISDFSNTVEQNMQAIWHTNDVVFPTEIVADENGNEKEVVKKPKNGDWLQTFTPQDGKTPLVEPLSINYDYGNMLKNIMSRRSLILEKCYMPQRTDGTNSTGVAQDIASGFSALDIIAESIQSCQEAAKLEEVKCVLAAIRKSPFVKDDDPLLDLTIRDIQPNVKRERLSEMATKANAFATYVSHGIYGLHALQLINAFPDTNKVWEDSKPLIEKYQASLFDKETASSNSVGGNGEQAPNSERTMQDLSDQVSQSPILQG